MCGILGAFWRTPPTNAIERIKAVMADLQHRGPDDQGRMAFSLPGSKTVALHLAHTRLSILDLSEAGRQPMHSPCGRYTVVFNGEIYNYKELRNELTAKGHRFTTETDTEVLLASYSHWGKYCLSKFIGMFAFALYDAKSATLICARDAFGIKPFFYSVDSEQAFLFASEMPALLRLKGGETEVNYQRVHDYLVHGLQDAPDGTFVEGIHHLPPANFLDVDLKSGTIREQKAWWSPHINQTRRLSFRDASEQLKELFISSVRVHMRSDVPIGAALSGGIDSSAVVCAMRVLEPDLPIHTFSYIPDDPRLSEEQWVDLVNQTVDAIPHKILIHSNDLLRDLKDLIRTQGEPFNSTSMYAQYRIFKEARACGIPVILEGQGADELLGGYQGYPGQKMRSLFERGRLITLLSFAKAWSANVSRNKKSPWRALVGQLLPEWWHTRARTATMCAGTAALLKGSRLLRHCIETNTPDMGRRISGYGRRLLETLAFSLTNNELPTLLRFGDRNAMRFSIENRVPFLTVELADFLLSLPEHYLVSDSGETKHLFRAAMRGIVPDAVLNRPEKIGFFTPMTDWIETHYMTFTETILTSRCGTLLNWPVFFREWGRSSRQRSSMTNQFWRGINLAFWSQANSRVRWGTE